MEKILNFNQGIANISFDKEKILSILNNLISSGDNYKSIFEFMSSLVHDKESYLLKIHLICFLENYRHIVFLSKLFEIIYDEPIPKGAEFLDVINNDSDYNFWRKISLRETYLGSERRQKLHELADGKPTKLFLTFFRNKERYNDLIDINSQNEILEELGKLFGNGPLTIEHIERAMAKAERQLYISQVKNDKFYEKV